MRINGQRSTELEKHADEWDRLAAEQPDTAPGRARAETYRRTAQSLRREAMRGVPHCACCMKPLASALPALNPTASPEQHANAAARIVADMTGGAA